MAFRLVKQDPPSETALNPRASVHNPTVQKFLLVVLISLIARLAVLLVIRNAPFASDAQEYTAAAKVILSGKSFVPYWPPGASLYLAPFIAAGASPVVLRASILVFWLLACWSLFRLMKELGVAAYAWLVLLVFSLLPDAIQMPLEPMTQMPVAALLLTALSAAVIAIRTGAWKEYVLLGLAFGMTALTRPSTLPLLIFVPLVCALASRRILPVAVTVVLGVAVVGAWVDRVHSMTGHWITNAANSRNIYYGNNPWTPDYRTWYFGSHAKEGSDEIKAFPEFESILTRVDQLPLLEQGPVFQQLADQYIRTHFGRFAYRTLNRVRCYWGFDTFTAAALSHDRSGGVPWSRLALLMEALTYCLLVGTSVFCIAAAPAAFWKDWIPWLLLGTMLIYAAPYWLSMSHPTYHFPLLLPLAVLGAMAWAQVDRARARPARAWVAVCILFLIQVEWVWRMSRGSA